MNSSDYSGTACYSWGCTLGGGYMQGGSIGVNQLQPAAPVQSYQPAAGGFQAPSNSYRINTSPGRAVPRYVPAAKPAAPAKNNSTAMGIGRVRSNVASTSDLEALSAQISASYDPQGNNNMKIASNGCVIGAVQGVGLEIGFAVASRTRPEGLIAVASVNCIQGAGIALLSEYNPNGGRAVENSFFTNDVYRFYLKMLYR